MNFKAIFIALFLLLAPTLAQTKEPPSQTQAQQVEPNESNLQEHNHYINKKGKNVHSPAHSKSGAIPNGASAHCGDGTYSFSQSHRGTCSHHGGVAQWIH